MTTAPGCYHELSDPATVRYWGWTGWTHVAADGVAVASDWRSRPEPTPLVHARRSPRRQRREPEVDPCRCPYRPVAPPPPAAVAQRACTGVAI
jgi:hypothetical protein